MRARPLGTAVRSFLPSHTLMEERGNAKCRNGEDGEYPTPSQTLDLLRRVVAVAAGANLRILDPCAGEGQALWALAERCERKVLT